MSLPRSVAEVLNDHVTLEVEGIDRMYLNVYQPRLQTERGVAAFFRFHRGETFASSALMDPISKTFIAAVERFVEHEQIPRITFAKGQRKDDIAKQYHAQYQGTEGIVFVGKAQEKTPVFGTEKRRNPDTGRKYPWIVRRTAMVNHFYFYGLDADFGPFFLKICTYFPYNAKLCINGHEYVKRQLAKEGIAFEALDNGILSCANPRRLQQLCDGLSPAKIDALLRKWLRRLPHPWTAKDRAAGYRYDISILQAEFSLTQVLDRPLSGRVFFEEVIRENLDLGRPDQVQLIFDRRITKRTPGRFRTRVLTEGVTPSLHIDYKHSRIKQYHKEGLALRTETTINDARDFGIVGVHGPNELPVPDGYTRVYRAVSEAEYQDILKTGQLRQGPNSLEGKWFADSLEGAKAHATGNGKTPPLFPDGKYRLIEVDVPNNAPSLSTRPNLDGHGPARYLHNDDLPPLKPRPLE